MSILDHVSINVTDVERSLAFYQAALAPLEIVLIMRGASGTGFGRGQQPQFWLRQGVGSFQSAEQLKSITPVHICFSARSSKQVDAFHAAALAAGGRDFGVPGRRPEYHPGYYGAFVLDPDGHDVEAVIHNHSA
jgi:catechol 2,3-dioxygenase-like lactoylglutathione lyase family enzyme